MRKLTTKEFIYKANIVHNNRYDYSLSTYTTNRSKITIICPIHGEFEQTGSNHLNGQECPECFGKFKSSIGMFITKANKVHHTYYNYSKSNYVGVHTKIIIICPIHGEFEQTPHDHLQKRGCPKCKSSKGEIYIREFLKSHNIVMMEQKRFPNCKDKKPLPFDFYLPEYNTCIEFDGVQHHIPSSFSSDKRNSTKLQNLSLIQQRDKIKDEYCRCNNIHLIRIPYYSVDDVDNILISRLSL